MAAFMSNMQTKNSLLNFEATIPDHCDLQTQYVYESNVHSQNILSSLNDQRKNGLLCDITVIVEGVRIPAHKAVLAACSTYFNGLITDPENISHNIVLELSTVSKVAMESLLEFAYTSKLTISSKNITQILEAIRELDIKNIEYSCLNILKEKLLNHADSLITKNKNSTTPDDHLQNKNSERRGGSDEVSNHHHQQQQQQQQVSTVDTNSQNLRSICTTKEATNTTTTGCKTTGSNEDVSVECFEVQPQPAKPTHKNTNNYCPAMSGLSLSQRGNGGCSHFGSAMCSLGPEACCMATSNRSSVPSTSTNVKPHRHPQPHHPPSKLLHQQQHPPQLAPKKRDHDQASGFSNPLSNMPNLPYCQMLTKDGNLVPQQRFTSWQQSEAELSSSSGSNQDKQATSATCVSFAPSSDLDDGEDSSSSKNTGGGLIESYQLVSSSSSQCCFSTTISSGGGKSEKKSCTNVVLPFSFEQITKLPRSDLQELLNKHPDLTQKQLNTIHELRRRGKNRIAAQRCRKRKMDFIRDLQCKMDSLRNQHSKLIDERLDCKRKTCRLLENFQQLRVQVFTACRNKVKKLDGSEGGDDSEKLNKDYENQQKVIQSMAEHFQVEAMKLESFVERLKEMSCDHLPPAVNVWSANSTESEMTATSQLQITSNNTAAASSSNHHRPTRRSNSNDEIVILCHEQNSSHPEPHTDLF